MKGKITDKLVRELEPPEQGQLIVYDTELKGFGIRITAGGVRSFIFNYQFKGHERRTKIGPYPAWSVVAARDKAKELRREVDNGGDPEGKKQAARVAPTVKELAERYVAEWLPRKRPSSRRDDLTMLDQIILPAIGKLKVADVTFADLDKLHRQVSATRPYRANRMLSLAATMFGLAVRWQLRRDNPAKGIERNQEHRRERFLSPDELQRLSAALGAYPNRVVANAIFLLMLTGARRGEVLSATWSQFDLDAGVWTKPRTSTKQKREHRVPLSGAALQLLVGIKAGAKPGVYVFPGRDGEAPLVEVKAAWSAICKEAGILGCRLHDLRHTYASILASAGLSLPIIGALLGHAQPGTTARYAHLLDDPLRQATERVGALLTAATSGRTGEVVELGAGKRGRHD